MRSVFLRFNANPYIKALEPVDPYTKLTQYYLFKYRSNTNC